jgi:protein-tyrosine phosphatase
MSLILPNLWLGNLDILHDSEFLTENNITHVITLLEMEVTTYPMVKRKIKQMYIKIYDADDAPIGTVFEATSAFIDDALAAGGAVYVHCLMGMSRSPTILAAYLIKKHAMTAKEALDYLQSVRPIVDPNSGFREALEKWERNVKV